MHPTPAAKTSPLTAAPLIPSDHTKRPLDLHQVQFAEDSFWGGLQSTNTFAILETAYKWMVREGWIGNFVAAQQGRLPEDRRGREFTDSDVYKLLEATIWENARRPEPRFKRRILNLILLIAGAQEPDGYINTNFGRDGQRPRYSDLMWGHELYNFGHLLQAAVAELRTTGEGPLTAVARKVADHVVETFGVGANPGICGHPEIELGLIEFGRATSDTRYIDQARIFLERRGHGTLHDTTFGPEYALDDVPIRDAKVLRGHAVRAVYLSAAAVDIAVEDGDTPLLATLENQWFSTIARRTYLTGGMGSRHEDEAFGADYELPSEHAYSETCAGVGAIMWSWRLLLATNDVRYADFVERVLFNVVATSPSADGSAFFYANTLHQREITKLPALDLASTRASSSMRAPWFEVSCCPPNVARTLATLASYSGWTSDDGMTLTLWSAMTVKADLPDGTVVQVAIDSEYPHRGRNVIRVEKSTRPWSLTVRIPEWARGATLTRNGQIREVNPGWLELPTVGAVAEEIILDVPLAPRRTTGNPRIDSARAAVAIQRGPLVYALESVDIDGKHVDDLVVTGQPRTDGAEVYITGQRERDAHSNQPLSGYQHAADHDETAEIRLTPYYQWGQRGPSTMRVWMRTE